MEKGIRRGGREVWNSSLLLSSSNQLYSHMCMRRRVCFSISVFAFLCIHVLTLDLYCRTADTHTHTHRLNSARRPTVRSPCCDWENTSRVVTQSQSEALRPEPALPFIGLQSGPNESYNDTWRFVETGAREEEKTTQRNIEQRADKE